MLTYYDTRWRRFRGGFRQRIFDAWMCLTGSSSLHLAWQRGFDDHIVEEGKRRSNGGN